MKKLNNKGFGAVEVLLIVVVLALVVGGGYFVYSRQNHKSNSNPVATSSEPSNAKASTVDDAVTKLGAKITSLASSKYKVEKLDGSATEIKTSATQKVSVAKGDSIFYRTDPLDTNHDTYTKYVDNLDKDLKTLNDYASNTLGMKEIYTYQVDGAAATFNNTGYQIGSSYILVEQSDGGYVISWTK